jgi:plasmid stabilization system protein ParE
MGRQVPELESATFREVIVEEYRLVYMVRGEGDSASVDVLAVAHGRQDLRKKLSRRE